MRVMHKGLYVKHLVRRYLKALMDVEAYAESLCRLLENTLKSAIPDIKCNVGWEEAGPDILALYSESHSVGSLSVNEVTARTSLVDVISKYLPELKDHIDCPYGVYLSNEEVKRVEEAIKLMLSGG